MNRIRVLPDQLVNQIAAGEVIERPASVVKELIENALDAGAGTITCDLERGGRRRMRVADDGHGMGSDDALLALERHATSKLSSDEDLQHIATLGFRGEALPAIASVSRLTLHSSTDGARGTCIDVEGGRILGVRDAGHPRGTTVDVRDLFFNTPARAKFLRAPATEVGHISDLFASYAAAHPGVRMTLVHEGRRLLDAPPAVDLADRLRQIEGDAWEDTIRFDAASGAVRVHGLIMRPGRGLATRRHQHIYVNGRLVRDRLIGHALLAACESYLPKDRYAGIFLFIECEGGGVDVNVHPAKAEVRFRDGRGVHDLVRDTVRAALAEAMPITPLIHGDEPDRATAAAGATRGEGDRSWAPSRDDRRTSIREATERWLGATPAPQRDDRRPPPWPAGGVPDAAPGARALFPGAAVLAHYRQSYILAEDDEGLLLVDQHAAHERILFERLQDEVAGAAPARQGLMFPVTLSIPRPLADHGAEVAAELETLGFEAEPFGEGTLVVRAVPACLEGRAGEGLLGDLLETLADRQAGEPGSPILEPARNALLATVACHAAIKVRMPLTLEKMNYLIQELFRSRTPLRCPHGRPAILRFSHRAIEQGFDRP